MGRYVKFFIILNQHPLFYRQGRALFLFNMLFLKGLLWFFKKYWTSVFFTVAIPLGKAEKF